MLLIKLSRKKSQLQPKLRVLISQGVVNCLVRSAIRRNSKWSTEAHIPTPWYGQDRTHAHNHITRAVAARDSYFALLGAHQHGIASTVSLVITDPAFYCRSGCINLTFVVACERQTFLLAHLRPGTIREEERLRFSDRNFIPMTQNLSGIRSEALIGRRSSFIVLAFVYEWQPKDKRRQRSNVNTMNL